MRRDEKKCQAFPIAQKRGERVRAKEKARAKEKTGIDMIQTAVSIIRGEDVVAPAVAKKKPKSAFVPFLLGCLFSACLCTAAYFVFVF